MNQEDLKQCYDFVLKLTIESGKVIRDAIQGCKNIETKAGDWDLVTEYDKKVEEILIRSLEKKFPEHRFIGEETVSSTNYLPQLTEEPTWIIDPIDGTTNFVHAFPFTCISIALAVKKQVEIAIVYNPVLEQLFTARRGRGAFLNGKPIKSSSVEKLERSLLCLEASYATIENIRDITLGRVEAFVSVAHGIRTIGSAALTLCYVAMGAVDGYHTDNLMPWDVAAGVLMIREAGGVVLDTSGGELNLMSPKILAGGNRKLANELVKLIKKADVKTEQRKLIYNAMKEAFSYLCCLSDSISLAKKIRVFWHTSSAFESSVVLRKASMSVIMSGDLDIKYCFEFVKELTMKAGEIFKCGFEGEKVVNSKAHEWDLVTDYDRKIEQVLIEGLRTKFPDHDFMGEETVAAMKQKPVLTDQPTWIIDPIDGTINYVNQFPFTCISVALAVCKEIVIGIIYDPLRSELYTAMKGQGAFLNGKPIKTSGVTELKSALIEFQVFSLRATCKHRDITAGRLDAVINAARGVRFMGSATLALAYVAKGALDCFQMDKLQPWDVAAGVLIIQEAGGSVMDTKEEKYNFMEPKTIAAGNETLAREVKQLIIDTDLKTLRKRLLKAS